MSRTPSASLVPPRMRTAATILAAVALVAVAARVSVAVPGSRVPQSLQTLAVVLVGGLLGARRGALALVAYVAAGALGLPVFADGAAGPGHLVGPTAGYLVGFVLGAAVVGWAVRGGATLARAFGAGVGAHAVILACGWARLAASLGPTEAWTVGVTPFLAGGVAKSLVAAAALAGFSSARGSGSAASP